MLVVPVLTCGCAHAHHHRVFLPVFLTIAGASSDDDGGIGGSGGRCVDRELRLCGCCGLLRVMSLLIHAAITARHSVTHLQSISPAVFMTPSAFNASSIKSSSLSCMF
uniref:Uncharacterized protein n=1 Tax=Physcomitrium patens TaxID=3218 RepID=A0A2K1JDY3_PHYPA|nr:hypothetical protein PHYPA_019998 [Physcomitrium patens]